MFLPFRLRGLDLANRVVVSPMAQYCAVDGVKNSPAIGISFNCMAIERSAGAGLVYTEMTCVSASGRITPGCTGLWNEAQRDAWRRIVEFVHRNSPAKICLQLGHAGRKGSTRSSAGKRWIIHCPPRNSGPASRLRQYPTMMKSPNGRSK